MILCLFMLTFYDCGFHFQGCRVVILFLLSPWSLFIVSLYFHSQQLFSVPVVLPFPECHICTVNVCSSWIWFLSLKKKKRKKVAQLYLDSSDPMDYTVHGILQARILERVAISLSRGSSQPRDWTQVSCIAGGFFTSWATREAQVNILSLSILHLRTCVVFNNKWSLLTSSVPLNRLPWWLSGKESTCSCGRHGFPWVGKIPCRRKSQPTPVFLPWKPQGQRSRAGYSSWSCKSWTCFSDWNNNKQQYH